MPTMIVLDYNLPNNCKMELELQNILGLSGKSDKFSPYYDEISKYKISNSIIGILIGGLALLIIVFIAVFIVER